MDIASSYSFGHRNCVFLDISPNVYVNQIIEIIFYN